MSHADKQFNYQPMHFNPKNFLEQMASIKNPISAWKWLCAGLEATLATFEVQGCSGGVTVHCSTLCTALQLCAAGECRIHITHTHRSHLTPPPYNNAMAMKDHVQCIILFSSEKCYFMLASPSKKQFLIKTNTVERANKRFFVML